MQLSRRLPQPTATDPFFAHSLIFCLFLCICCLSSSPSSSLLPSNAPPKRAYRLNRLSRMWTTLKSVARALCYASAAANAARDSKVKLNELSTALPPPPETFNTLSPHSPYLCVCEAKKKICNSSVQRDTVRFGSVHTVASIRFFYYLLCSSSY